MADIMKKEYELANIYEAYGIHEFPTYTDIITVSVVRISIRLWLWSSVPHEKKQKGTVLWYIFIGQR